MVDLLKWLKEQLLINLRFLQLLRHKKRLNVTETISADLYLVV